MANRAVFQRLLPRIYQIRGRDQPPFVNEIRENILAMKIKYADGYHL